MPILLPGPWSNLMAPVMLFSARSGRKIAAPMTGFKVQPPSVRRSGDIFRPVRNRAESVKAELDAHGLVNWHAGFLVVTRSAAKHKASILLQCNT
jgi:hypothetical protein